MGSELIHSTGLPAVEIAGRVNDSLARNSNIVITAPPGAGKSTILPLTIQQGAAGDGKVIVLEPRRIAARQIAERMAYLSGEAVGGLVGYRVRYESRVSSSTRVKVLTEGILTRMIVDDPTLDGVSVLIFDEFHERSINCDLALALALRTQKIIRPDLKIVVMSATMDASAVCSALEAPLIESEGRIYPIINVYDDCITDFRDITGPVARSVLKAFREQEGGILAFLPGEADIRKCAALLEEALPEADVFPLYGMMPFEQQNRAIAPCRNGERKIVLATPIAETSLTIEDIRVVVDSGLYRRQIVDPQSGLGRLETARISIDMADQRRGRAGRVAPGVCYRLWQRTEESNMRQCRVPEILEADLAPMLLQIAAWGGCAAAELDWMSAPPAGALAKASSLLQLLGALDDKGFITSHGRSLASIPCHPRIANMLVGAVSPDSKALAADIAALLDERDPMSQSIADSDISTRLAELRRQRSSRHPQARWANIIKGAQQYRALLQVAENNDITDSYEVGMLLASAYPERIAKQQKEGCGHFLLANGEKAVVDKDDIIAAYDWISVACMNSSKGGEGRIFLASPLDPASVQKLARARQNVSWDARKGAVLARNELNIGCLNISSNPVSDVSPEVVFNIICEAAPKYGLSMFDFNDDVANLQRRIAAAASWHPELELPDMSTESVLASASIWLQPNIGKATTTAELKKINLCDALLAMLTYDQQTALNRIAPAHILVPTGSRIAVEYRQGAENPILRVRIQECFGMCDSPRVDGGRIPVVMELLSPGFKPVQLTSDLKSFWAEGYFEVRKELKRRYPKHYWPDNPLNAEPVRGVLKKPRQA